MGTNQGFTPLHIIIAIALVAAIAWGGYYWRQNAATRTSDDATSSPASSDSSQVMCTQDAKQCPDGSYVSRKGINCEFAACPTPQGQTASPTNWETYTSARYGFSIKHPSTLTVKEEADRIVLWQWGPTQKEGTEFYDGIYINIKSGELYGPLQNFVYQKVKESEQRGEILQSPQPTKVNGVAGFTYRASGLGEYTYLYLSSSPNKYTEIINGTNDPQKQGFIAIANQIISSITLAK